MNKFENSEERLAVKADIGIVQKLEDRIKHLDGKLVYKIIRTKPRNIWYTLVAGPKKLKLAKRHLERRPIYLVSYSFI